MYNHVDNGKQPMHPYQYVWMLPWSALEQQNQLSTFFGHHGYGHNTNPWHLQNSKEITSDISGSVEQHTEINAIDFGIVKSNQAMSSKNQRKDRLESLDSSINNLPPESQQTSNVEHVSSLLSLAPPGTKSSKTNSHIQHKSVPQCPRELVNTHKIFGTSLGFSAPLAEGFSGTSSVVSPRIFDLGKGRCESGSIPTAPSFMCRVEENDNRVRSILSSDRNVSDANIIKVMEHEKCSDGSGVLSDNLAMRNNYPPAFREEQYKKMNNFSNINTFPTYAYEANTMRIYTAAENLGGFTPIPRYQANHTFPVMENTDPNLRKKNQNFRDSRVLTQVQENVPIKCHSFPQLIGHGKQDVPILVLSSDSEEDDDVNDVSAPEVVSKNASAETHTMDMNVIKEKHVSGVQPSSSNKYVSANTTSPHSDLAIGTHGEKVQSRKRLIPEIPDMNIQLHTEPGGASVVGNADPSTSQTRSLDMDYVPDSSSGWLKRLKISEPCNNSVGTKSLRLDEATTTKKANQFVSRGIGGETSNSEPVPVSTGKEVMIVDQEKTPPRAGKEVMIVDQEKTPPRAGKEVMIVDQEKTPPRAAVSSSKDNEDGNDGTKRLNTWIQRWQKSPTATPKDRSEPEPSKETREELEKTPLSNIAAMALLGKGMRDVKCYYRNVGTYTLWEYKDMHNLSKNIYMLGKHGVVSQPL